MKIYRIIYTCFDIDTEEKTAIVKTFLDGKIASEYLKERIEEIKSSIEEEYLDLYRIKETETSFESHSRDSAVESAVKIWLEKDETYDEILLRRKEQRNNKQCEKEKDYEV